MVQWVQAMSGCFDLTDMPRISFTKLGYIPMKPLTDYSTPWITDKEDSPKGSWAGNHHIWISRHDFLQKFNGSKMEDKFISPITKSNSNIFLWCASFSDFSGGLLVRIIANCHGGDPNWPLDFSKSKKGMDFHWFLPWNCPVNSVNKVHFVWRYDDICLDLILGNRFLCGVCSFHVGKIYILQNGGCSLYNNPGQHLYLPTSHIFSPIHLVLNSWQVALALKYLRTV